MNDPSTQPVLLRRRRWHIQGQVQGVGFRPFVWRLAHEHRLTGFIRNDSSGVILEAQADERQLEGFIRALQEELPPLARIDKISTEDIPLVGPEADFTIQASEEAAGPQAAVTVDTAVCEDCRRELFDPADRRFGYGLINCTNCGPRFSIIQRVPYDRVNTTMSGFAMCPACAAEYASPASRRFHAQPISCPACGPQVELVGLTPLPPREGLGEGESTQKVKSHLQPSPGSRCSPPSPSEGEGFGTPTLPSPVKGEGLFRAAAQMLWDGKILAIKGLGGFHLAVRADDADAVGRLRARKHRDAKPFALMCRTLEEARRLVQLDDQACALLTSREAPIVLAMRNSCGPDAPVWGPKTAEGGCSTYSPVAEEIAPGNHRLGVMLPYTPIHHLLFAELARMAGAKRCSVLVMTSGNLSDEPLVIDNQEAIRRLGGLCDAILWHDRPIERALDDSVYLSFPGADPLPIRRSRGFVPTEIPLPCGAASSGGPGPAGEPVPHTSGLCVGGELKNTIAVVRSGSAILSQHLGDLTHALGFEYFKTAIDDLIGLFGIDVGWIAHDLHPQYLSTAYARELARRWDVPRIGIQHHHAHAASVMAEYGLAGPVLAVTCDGTGYGPDGTIWGGELLLADLKDFKRLARLRPLLLAGGDAAAKDIRRCALALLYQAYGDEFRQHPLAARIVPGPEERTMLCTMLARRVNCAVSSGTGRYFDGVSALLGLCAYNAFEAQAAMKLEAAAAAMENPHPLESQPCFELRPDENQEGVKQIDLSPLIRRLAEGVERNENVCGLSARFHDQLAWAWAVAAADAVQTTGLRTVVFSGGVFCNQRFSQGLQKRLEEQGLKVLRHRLVPANDGGISLGQAAIAVARTA